MVKNREQFRSTLGFIFASSGSAIGLGNIWRFPYLAGTNGGGAFVLIYAILMLTIGASLLLVEFVIGKNSHANTVKSYGNINKRFRYIGYLNIFTSFIILSFYSVVGGWTIYFLFKSITGLLISIPGDEITTVFQSFTASSLSPLIYTFIFLALNIYIVAKGIALGIEKYNEFLMPLLFLILLILLVRSLTLPGAIDGIIWYLKPDFSKINSGIIVAAFGQVFFSLSVGLSTMVVYGSYLSRNENLPRASALVALFDFLISIMAGLVIFPAVFSFAMKPSEGPGLVFITLPQVFSMLPFGYFFLVLFFILLVLAALSSSISMMEVAITYFIETYNIRRVKMSIIYGFIVFLLAIPLSLSFGILNGWKIFGMQLFDLFDYFSANVSLPFSALACTILVGWFWNKEKIKAVITNGNKNNNHFFTYWFLIVKYLIPPIITVIWLNAIGII